MCYSPLKKIKKNFNLNKWFVCTFAYLIVKINSAKPPFVIILEKLWNVQLITLSSCYRLFLLMIRSMLNLVMLDVLNGIDYSMRLLSLK